MYKFEEKQLSFTDFNQPQGLQMNPENRWIKKAEMIPWDTIEKEYAKQFPAKQVCLRSRCVWCWASWRSCTRTGSAEPPDISLIPFRCAPFRQADIQKILTNYSIHCVL